MRWSILAIALVAWPAAGLAESWLLCCVVAADMPLRLPPSPRAIESRRSERRSLTRWPRSGSSHSGMGGITALACLGVSSPSGSASRAAA